MGQYQVDLNAESGRLHAELVVFEQEVLPVLFRRTNTSPTQAMGRVFERRLPDLARCLPDWQQATRMLADFLRVDVPLVDGPPLDRSDFAAFLFQKPTASFRIQNGRIVWRIETCMPLDLTKALDYPFVAPELGAICRNDIGMLVREIKQWFIDFPARDDECCFYNTLCTLLPVVADVDPDFAKAALDRDTYRFAINADGTLTDGERSRRMKVVNGFYLGHVLNNALLHVLAALANNHFMRVRDFLVHPHLHGGYTHLMPHYLFAVLFSKVVVLHTHKQLLTPSTPENNKWQYC